MLATQQNLVGIQAVVDRFVLELEQTERSVAGLKVVVRSAPRILDQAVA